MANSDQRTVEVVRRQKISPHMLRLTLGGEGLANFPEKQDSAYFKLCLPDSNGGEMLRTYTIRNHDQENQEFDVDFVLHDVDGPATNWAKSAQPGDTIDIHGPGAKKLVDPSAAWFLLIGDMSALPAISANLAMMPDMAEGIAILEIIDGEDKQELLHPPGVEVRWVVNPHPDRANTVLLEHIRRLSIPKQPASVWVAGEFSSVIEIRRFLKSELNVTRQQLYASSYWQIGRSEDQHKIAKRNAATD